MKPLLVGAAALAATISTAPAFANDLIVKNLTSFTIRYISADPGDITNFRSVPAGSRMAFKIEMPSGQCDARFRVTFDDGQTLEMRGNVCPGLRLEIGERH